MNALMQRDLGLTETIQVSSRRLLFDRIPGGLQDSRKKDAATRDFVYSFTLPHIESQLKICFPQGWTRNRPRRKWFSSHAVARIASKPFILPRAVPTRRFAAGRNVGRGDAVTSGGVSAKQTPSTRRWSATAAGSSAKPIPIIR